jgi:hypothetical protein
MDTRSSPSPSATTAESDLLTRFLQAAERLWPGSTRSTELRATLRIPKLIAQHDEWLKKKKTNGRCWYDIISDTLDENWKSNGSDAGESYFYDSTNDAA